MRRLYGYWRSSAAYRVRIALNIKGLDYEQVAIDLRAGQQKTPEYLRHNPHGLVPWYEEDGVGLAQSAAIIEYLEERYPEPPLLPTDPAERAAVRAICQLVACEIHPLNNLRVLNYLRSDWNCDEEQVLIWYRHWIAEGMAMLERQLERTAGRYCFGDQVTMADVFLVPQVYNARRYRCPLAAYPKVCWVEANCNALRPFELAMPERQPDAAL